MFSIPYFNFEVIFKPFLSKDSLFHYPKCYINRIGKTFFYLFWLAYILNALIIRNNWDSGLSEHSWCISSILNLPPTQSILSCSSHHTQNSKKNILKCFQSLPSHLTCPRAKAAKQHKTANHGVLNMTMFYVRVGRGFIGEMFIMWGGYWLRYLVFNVECGMWNVEIVG